MNRFDQDLQLNTSNQIPSRRRSSVSGVFRLQLCQSIRSEDNPERIKNIINTHRLTNRINKRLLPDENDREDNVNTILTYATLFNRIHVAQTLLSEFCANINARNKRGNTPILIAVARNFTDLAQYFIVRQADVTIRNDKGKTVTEIVHEQNNSALMELLPQPKRQTRGSSITSRPARRQSIVNFEKQVQEKSRLLEELRVERDRLSSQVLRQNNTISTQQSEIASLQLHLQTIQQRHQDDVQRIEGFQRRIHGLEKELTKGQMQMSSEPTPTTAPKNDETDLGSMNGSEFFEYWMNQSFSMRKCGIWERVLFTCQYAGLDDLSFWVRIVESELNSENCLIGFGKEKKKNLFSVEKIFVVVLGIENTSVIGKMKEKIKNFMMDGNILFWLWSDMKMIQYVSLFEDNLGIASTSDLWEKLDELNEATLLRAGMDCAGHRVRFLFEFRSMMERRGLPSVPAEEQENDAPKRR